MQGKQFDYIIVGAGSAGCVLANRLSANPSRQVLLLEAGGSDSSPFIQMPAALSIPMNTTKYNWGFYTLPESNLNGRKLHCPRGKVIGGSSSINGMVYVRGNPLDFDAWHHLGAKNWDYKHVLPYFKRAENYCLGENTYRGGRGPLYVEQGKMKNPLYKAFVQAGKEAGFPVTKDPNGAQQEGFGPMDMTTHKGKRWSAANAYLHPIKHRANLTILKHAQADKVVIAKGQAIGLRYFINKKEYYVKAKQEIILSAGPINSPRILLRSGIGPWEYLQNKQIDVVRNIPGVGQNLMDHLELYVQYKCKQPITLYPTQSWWRKGLIGAKWLLTKKGLGATNHFEAGAFIRSDEQALWPNLQYHFLPLAISYDGKHMPKYHGFQVHVGPMRSQSRGFVDLDSIQFNYMSYDRDWEEMRDAIRITRNIMNQPAMAKFKGDELAPGKDAQSDFELDRFVRMNAESAYHPCGTCKMGEDNLAVVNSECQVFGVQGLRVVDSSIMPQITTGNLNAPTIMLAEKASDIILGKKPIYQTTSTQLAAEEVI